MIFYYITICDYHTKMKNETIITIDDLRTCIKCTCNMCAEPLKYCNCNQN